MLSYSDSSSDSDDDIDEECSELFTKENSVWNSPKDNRVLRSPFLSLSPTALWGDLAIELDNTPGTPEFKIAQKREKKRILQEKIKKEEQKKIPSVKLGEKTYYTTRDIAKNRDKISNKYEHLFNKKKKRYCLLDPVEQSFLWDLLKYFPFLIYQKNLKYILYQLSGFV